MCFSAVENIVVNIFINSLC